METSGSRARGTYPRRASSVHELHLDMPSFPVADSLRNDSATNRMSLPPVFRPTNDTSYDPSQTVAFAEVTSASPRFSWNGSYSKGSPGSPLTGPGPLRAKSILQRITSIRSPLSPFPRMNDRYTKIEATDEDNSKASRRQKSLDEDGKHAEEPSAYGFDISMFDGGAMALQEIKSAPYIIQEESGEEDNVLSAEGNETERTKYSGPWNGGLGDGMTHLKKFRVTDPQRLSRATGLERSKTIREVAHLEANRREAIIAVNEPVVDLDSLAGNDKINRSNSSTFEGMSRQSTINDAPTQSYFFPDEDRPNWKPIAMNRFYILFLIVISIVMSAMQEWVYQQSKKLRNQDPPSGILEFNSPAEISTWNFFSWKYLPTFILVSFGVFWQISDYEIKRLEPYYQLSKPHGSTAAESLNMDYLTFASAFVPMKALYYRQWAVFCSSVATLLAGALTPALQSASVILVHNDRGKDEDVPRFFVRIDAIWSRLLTSTLAIVAGLGIVLLWQLERKSGLLSDPRGIAGIAAMANKSHILTDFQGMDREKHGAIHKKLRNRRYILYKSTIWQEQYISDNNSIEQFLQKTENSHPLMLRLRAGVPFMLFLLGFLILIPVLLFTPANVAIAEVPWVMTLIGSIIKLIWSALEYSLRMLEPFWILSKRHAPPSILTLDYTGTMYGIMPLKALMNKNYFLAMIGIGSIMADVLTVCVSSFSVNGNQFIDVPRHGSTAINGDETYKSFWTSFALAAFIILYLFTAAVLTYTYRRRVFLPRQPSTIASVMAYIHQSKMLTDFVDTERCGHAEMDRILNAMGKTYGLGEFRGRDGEVHCGIDEEELLRGFSQEWSLRDATAPWIGGDTWLP